MITVNFILKNNPNAMTLVFKAFKNADESYFKALGSPNEKLDFEDDFGLRLNVDMREIASVSMSEYEKDMDKNMDLQIVQHKAQLKAQSRAKNDMGLQILERSNAPLINGN